MSRIRYQGWSGGLWLSGPREITPSVAFRRAKGIAAVRTGSIRSRYGSVSAFAPGTAHSLYRFKDIRYAGVGTTLVNASGTAIKTGLNGNRLAFVRMPSTIDEVGGFVDDYLFVAGGGDLFKVDAAGAATQWGIDAPADGVTATAQPADGESINTMDTHGDWTGSGITGKANDDKNKQQGTDSTLFNVSASNTGYITAATTVDLTQYTGPPVVQSSDEDFITFWMQVDQPENLEFAQISFALGAVFGDTGFAADEAADTYTATVTPDSDFIDGVFGLGSIEENEQLFADENSLYHPLESPNDPKFKQFPNILKIRQRNRLARNTIPKDVKAWTKVRIPKANFTRSGSNTALTWADVQGSKFTIKTNSQGAVKVWLDDLKLGGSVGMQGHYQYHYTFYNSTTKHRSNPNPTAVDVDTVVDRQAVAIAGIPATSSDPQVDTVEIWRTFGDGAFFYRNGTVPIGTTTYTDVIADYIGLNSQADTTYMQSTVLVFDNEPPLDTYNRCAGPHQGRMWWTGDTATGAGGRVYYSPPGRPESAGRPDWVDVTDVDDPVREIVTWGGNLYALSEGGFFEITGSGEPFSFRQLPDSPGTTAPDTVASTPAGIIYEAADGLRVFNGSSSVLASPDGILPIFRGQTRENIAPFTGVIATYGRGEYFISDLLTTLALDLREGLWREIGGGTTAMFYEPDTEELLFARNGKVLRFEVEGVYEDDGAPIPFEVETAAVLADIGQETIVQRVYVRGTTSNEIVYVDLVTDTGVTQLGVFQAAGHDVREYAICHSCWTPSIRLRSSYRQMIDISAIELDVHIGDAQLSLDTETGKNILSSLLGKQNAS